MNSKLTRILFVVLLFVGFCFGVLATKLNILGMYCNSSGFKYINKDLLCGSPFVVDKRAYLKLKTNLDDFIQQKIKEKEVTNVAFYFRDLADGPTLGINEHKEFSPASLLKLPLLLAYLNLSESKPALLETEIAYDGSDNNLNQNIPPKETLKQNTPYTINDVLKYMIRYSDNNAYYVLAEYLNQISPDDNLLQDTYTDLGIIDPRNDLSQTITVKSYASIFVQLFSSSYLNKQNSEKALALLSEADFTQGLKAGVPAEINIAHKFGDRTGFAGNLKQLHDCGIVYYPQNPYLICIMTQGYDLNKLEGVISDISKMTYDEFNSRKL